MSDMAAQAQEVRSRTFCHLCQKEVFIGHRDEYMILILGRNGNSSRIVFHCDCFFAAAGNEYKVALKYDQMAPQKPADRDEAIRNELEGLKRALEEEKMRAYAEKMKKFEEENKKYNDQMLAAQKMQAHGAAQAYKDILSGQREDLLKALLGK